MFRYIAIVWDASNPSASTFAESLCATCLEHAEWHLELSRPGLQVFVTGSIAGVNEAHVLQAEQGVVLGKVFRLRDLDARPPRRFALTTTDAACILNSAGKVLVTEFWGRYVAFFQSASGSIRVLRDPSGALPCFRIGHAGVTIVFSWLEDLLRVLTEVEPCRVNWGALKAHLIGGSLGGRETALEGVTQILPGESLDLHSGESTLQWSAMDFARSPAEHDDATATQLLRQGVPACTRAWASCYDTLLLRLSGGVDSSILFSCLAPGKTAADVIGINYYSEGSDSDERHYARLTAMRVGRDLLERERDPDFRIDRLLDIARMPEPIYYTGRLNAQTDAKLAAAYAAPALFTGAGGDSLFYEFPRWWPAADYLAAKGLCPGFLNAALDAARLGKVSVWQAIELALRERRRPDLGERSRQGKSSLLAPEVIREIGDLGRFTHPALRDADDVPIGKYMQTLSLMLPLTYYDPFEQAAAPELVNPLLSQPLVELCLRLPTYLLARGGRGRAVARRAFAPDLPAQIVNRRAKGGLEEHVKAILIANIDFVRTMLLEGQLARAGMLDRRRLEELLSGRPTALPGPISQIHGLVAVEAWLNRWR